MASRPSLVTPSGRLEMQDSSKFPSVKIPRFVSGGLAGNTSRSQRRQKLLPDGDEVDLNLHTDTNNFAPNEREELSIPPALLFTKDQHKR